MKRDYVAEFRAARIPGARFFDIEGGSLRVLRVGGSLRGIGVFKGLKGIDFF